MRLNHCVTPVWLMSAFEFYLERRHYIQIRMDAANFDRFFFSSITVKYSIRRMFYTVNLNLHSIHCFFYSFVPYSNVRAFIPKYNITICLTSGATWKILNYSANLGIIRKKNLSSAWILSRPSAILSQISNGS